MIWLNDWVTKFIVCVCIYIYIYIYKRWKQNDVMVADMTLQKCNNNKSYPWAFRCIYRYIDWLIDLKKEKWQTMN